MAISCPDLTSSRRSPCVFVKHNRNNHVDIHTSRRKLESMVHVRRLGVHHCGLGHGGGHGARPGLPVLGSRSKKIRPEYDHRVHGLVQHHHLSMVLLGLLPGLFASSDEWIHRRSESFWPDQHPWCPERWICSHSRAVVRFLPGRDPIGPFVAMLTTISRCNSAPSQPPLLREPWRSEDV